MLEHRGRAGTEGFRPASSCLWLWLWVGLVFRAPSDPAVGPGCFPCSRVVSVGPGCLMRSWAGLLGAPVGGAVGLLGVPVGRVAWCARGRRPAREIATREPDGSEWSISKLGQAPSRSLARPLWRRPQISAHTTLVSTSCSVPSARNNSPCVACCLLVREKIRPAGAKEAKNAVFRCAGRTFSQNRCRTGALGEFCTGFGAGCGTKFSLLGGVVVRAVQSSPCSCKTG